MNELIMLGNDIVALKAYWIYQLSAKKIVEKFGILKNFPVN